MKIFDYVIEIGLAAILIFSPLALGTVQVWSVSWVHFTTLFLGIIWALKLIVGLFGKERDEFKFSFIDIPVLGFLIWAFILTLRSNIPQTSWEEFLKVLNYALVYYLIVVNLKRKQAQRIALVIIIIGGAIATYGMVQKLQGTEGLIYSTITKPEQYAHRVSGTYICPNHFSGYLEIALSLCLGLLLFSSLNLGWKLLLGYAGLLMGAGIFLSISRGGYLSIAGAGIFLFVLGLLKKRFCAVIVFTLIILLFFSAFIFLGKENVVIDKKTVLARWKAVLDEPDNASEGRIHFWKGALKIIKNNPISGTGPGTFKWYFPRYRQPQTAIDLNYAHNDYLHYAADYGVVGLGLILLFFVALFGQGFSLIKGNNLWNSAIVGGVFASAVALLIHSVFDFNFHIPANAVTFVALVGLMRADNSITNYKLQITKLPQLTVGLGLVLVILFAMPLVVKHYLADKKYREGIRYEKEILWSEALNCFERAAIIDRDNFLYPAKMADLCLNKSRFKKEKEKYLKKALEYSKGAIRLNPQYTSQYLTQALIYEGLGENRNAVAFYTQTLELDPNNAHYHEAFGLFYLRQGEKEKANMELQKAKKIKWSGLANKLLKKLK